MRIQRIHLFNFRSVEDLTLDLAEDGLHALIGAFGSGKSSFLTGVRFALFGDNGEGGANLDLRRHHGIRVDRGRIVRVAVAHALKDLLDRGADSSLVAELRDQ